MTPEPNRWAHAISAGDYRALRKVRGAVFLVGSVIIGLTVGVTVLQAAAAHGGPIEQVASPYVPELEGLTWDVPREISSGTSIPAPAGGTSQPFTPPSEQPIPTAEVPSDPQGARHPATPVSEPSPGSLAVYDPTATPDDGLPENFYLPAVSDSAATELELRLLDGINRERIAAGFAPYTLDPGLSQIARVRTVQLADQGYFGHSDPHGYSMYAELLAYYGYSFAWAGETWR